MGERRKGRVRDAMANRTRKSMSIVSSIVLDAVESIACHRSCDQLTVEREGMRGESSARDVDVGGGVL